MAGYECERMVVGVELNTRAAGRERGHTRLQQFNHPGWLNTDRATSFSAIAIAMLPVRALHRLVTVSRHLTRTMSTTSEQASSVPSTSIPDVAAVFPVSNVPDNPLGQGRYIKTAAALIIGDEILNGKTLDTNTNFFAKFCFEQGIDLYVC